MTVFLFIAGIYFYALTGVCVYINSIPLTLMCFSFGSFMIAIAFYIKRNAQIPLEPDGK